MSQQVLRPVKKGIYASYICIVYFLHNTNHPITTEKLINPGFINKSHLKQLP
jgi:hypothetical protein